MFIIDFDNTLFNTTTYPGNFKDVRVKMLARVGISEELYKKTYGLARNMVGTDLAMYSDERHAEALSQFGFDKTEILKLLQSTLGENVKQFLFLDAIDFLKSLKEKGKSMVLFSLGDPEFQYLKVKGCDIEKYFDRVFMTPKPKKDVMHELLENVHPQEVWFVNDKVSETLDVLKEHPEIKAILKISANSTAEEYKESGLPYFKTLTEIKDYIENYE